MWVYICTSHRNQTRIFILPTTILLMLLVVMIFASILENNHIAKIKWRVYQEVRACSMYLQMHSLSLKHCPHRSWSPRNILILRRIFHRDDFATLSPIAPVLPLFVNLTTSSDVNNKNVSRDAELHQSQYVKTVEISQIEYSWRNHDYCVVFCVYIWRNILAMTH